MNAYPNLLSPIKIGKLELKNRGVMPPMVTNYGNPDGTVSDKLINYHEARAKGGVGLIIVECTIVDMSSHNFTGILRIDTDEMIPNLKKLVDTVHAAGAKIGIQIGHFGRQTNSNMTGMDAIAPSAIPCPATMSPTREMSVKEIKEMVTKFADAAERAKKAGFDLVELHGAHGYLVHEFLSPWANKRTDEYGGNETNRERFPMEILKECRKRVGDDFAITYRISVRDFLPDGLTLKDTAPFCKRLADNGIDAINVTGGNYAVLHMLSGCDDPIGMYVEDAAAIRKAVGGAVPVMVANRIRKPEYAEKIIREGKADMICLGRPHICDPDYFNKVKNGQEQAIRHCTSCLLCADALYDDSQVQCLYNPLVGQEKEFDLDKKTSAPKKLVVVGGGPAGMEAAYIAAHRGHKVVLFEKNSYLGGNVVTGNKPPFKEIGNVTDYLSYMAEKTGVDIRLNTQATLDLVKAEQPDMVFVASGSKPIRPNIPGADAKNVVLAEDILMGKIKPGKNVVVIGGGSVGVETADFIHALGNKVTVIEMLDEVLADATSSPKTLLLRRIEKDIPMKVSEKVIEIRENSVVTDKRAYDGIDTVVLAVGYKAYDELSSKLQDAGIPTKVIGDAVKARKIFEATQEGFLAAYNL